MCIWLHKATHTHQSVKLCFRWYWIITIFFFFCRKCDNFEANLLRRFELWFWHGALKQKLYYTLNQLYLGKNIKSLSYETLPSWRKLSTVVSSLHRFWIKWKMCSSVDIRFQDYNLDFMSPIWIKHLPRFLNFRL